MFVEEDDVAAAVAKLHSNETVSSEAVNGEMEVVEEVITDPITIERVDPNLLNCYGCPRINVVPRVLVIRDQTKQVQGRQFADFNVMRRDALIAKFLGTKSDNIPIPPRVWDHKTHEPYLVVVANDDRQAMKLLGKHSFGPFKVKVESHPSRNWILGKVFDRQGNILRMGVEQAAVDLEPQGVKKVEKLGKKEGLYKVTFAMYERPQFLRLGRIQVEVEE